MMHNISQSIDYQVDTTNPISRNKPHPLEDKKFILTFLPYDDGLGDMVFMEKIATHLHEKCHIPLNNIRIIAEFETQEHLIAAKDATIGLIQINHPFLLATRLFNHFNHNTEFLVNDSNPDVIIQGPGRPAQKRELRELPGVGSGEIVYIKAEEYNWDNDTKAATLGIGQDNFGIFIDDELENSSLEDHSGCNSLRHLKNLSPEIQKLILGDSYSDEAIERFHDNAELFFGYTYHAVNKLNFIAAVAHEKYVLESENKSLYFCFPGQFNIEDEQINQAIQSNAEEQKFYVPGEEGFGIPTTAIANLKAAGVHSIEITSASGSKKTFVINPSADPKKIVHMICLGRISHSSVLQLIEASEEESIGTGDQTASELFSAKKHFIYETRPHKDLFFKAQVALAKEVNKEFGQSLERTRKIIGFHYGISALDSAILFHRGKQEPEFKKAWDDYNKRVCKEHRFGPKFDHLIEERLQMTASERAKLQPPLPPLIRDISMESKAVEQEDKKPSKKSKKSCCIVL